MRLANSSQWDDANNANVNTNGRNGAKGNSENQQEAEEKYQADEEPPAIAQEPVQSQNTTMISRRMNLEFEASQGRFVNVPGRILSDEQVDFLNRLDVNTRISQLMAMLARHAQRYPHRFRGSHYQESDADDQDLVDRDDQNSAADDQENRDPSSMDAVVEDYSSPIRDPSGMVSHGYQSPVNGDFGFSMDGYQPSTGNLFGLDGQFDGGDFHGFHHNMGNGPR